MALPGTRHELCEWRFRDREVAWRPLARSIDTNARVGLLCRFDRESGERADCSLHARRSNRSELLQRNRYGKRGLAQSRLAGRVREARESALAAFDRARTLEAVAREVGELPESCREQGSALHCLWRTSSHTPGHGTLAARAGAASTKRIQLRCRFPSDGSGRAAGSCHATVGS